MIETTDRPTEGRQGPLAGLRVVEMAGIGPAPHCAMVLADLGADVVRVDRPGQSTATDLMLRGRRTVVADLKQEHDRDLVLAMITASDVVLEGFRPGVMERLGLGPDTCLARNGQLVYARLTGWGQEGPLAQRPGHDLNYLSLTGVLHAVGRPGDRPVPPLNLVGDFGGGSMLAVTGILAALWNRQRTGAGQVVDAAMIDGAALLSQEMWNLRAQGRWGDDRSAANITNGGAPFYDTYTCADGRFVAVAAILPQFYAQLLELLDLDAETLPAQHDEAGWPRLRTRFAEVFASRSRDEWAEVFDGTDACVTPVLTFAEAPGHPQVAQRRTLVEGQGHVQAAPAPRFSATPSTPPTAPGDSTPERVLEGWRSPRS